MITPVYSLVACQRLFMVFILHLLLPPKSALLVTAIADYERPHQTLQHLAFGSCHKRKKAHSYYNDASSNSTIWEVIRKVDQPDAWLWTGDAVYTSRSDVLRVIQQQKRESRQKDGDNHQSHWSSSLPIVSKWHDKYGPAPVSVLRMEYYELLANDTLGYKKFQSSLPMGVYGTWDDHDYGGNDMGKEIPNRMERQKAFYDFLQLDEPTMASSKKEEDPGQNGDKNDQQRRVGVYNSIEWGMSPNKVKSIMLDTRYHRDEHCIPSVGHRMPLGNAFACGTRWLTAGLNLYRYSWLWKPKRSNDDDSAGTKESNKGFNNKYDRCSNNGVLGEEQWAWFERELFGNDVDNKGDESAQVYVVVSSIQVLTTNPAMESWGHYPMEQRKFVELINRRLSTPYNVPSDKGDENRPLYPVVLVLSGDVHHAEILGQEGLVEVTSSGLTHDCSQPKLYGKLCEPILRTYNSHRYNHNVSNYYIGRNYGIINIDWKKNEVVVIVKDANGDNVLTSPKLTIGDNSNQPPTWESLPHTWDGHLIPLLQSLLLTIILVGGLTLRLLKRGKRGTMF